MSLLLHKILYTNNMTAGLTIRETCAVTIKSLIKQRHMICLLLALDSNLEDSSIAFCALQIFDGDDSRVTSLEL
jgi:hypothetical protein